MNRDEVVDQIINQMVGIYLMHTKPYLIIDKKSGEIVEQGDEWTNQEAEQLYSNYKKTLEQLA